MLAPPSCPQTRTSAAAGPAAPPACSAPSAARPSRQQTPTDRASASPWVGRPRCPTRRSRSPCRT
eukprot:15178631-Alexandrium_andersonii.AAC.1